MKPGSKFLFNFVDFSFNRGDFGILFLSFHKSENTARGKKEQDIKNKILYKIRQIIYENPLTIYGNNSVKFVHLSATEVEIFLAQCKRKNLFWENGLLKLCMVIEIYRRK